MNIFAIISSLLIIFASLTAGQHPAPENVRVQVASSAVKLMWDPVDNITQYVIFLDNGNSKVTENTEVIFAELSPSTDYTATISSADGNGTAYYEHTSVTFQTRLPAVTNLQVKHAGETRISVTWDPSNYSTGYSIFVKNETNDLIHPTAKVEGTTGTITGLEPTTYYYIYVIPLTSKGEGDPAVLRLRTDGTGVKLHLFDGSNGYINNGVAKVFRPMIIPSGPYKVEVNFGCALLSVSVWNADYDDKASDLTTGKVVVKQRKEWQKQKSMIGINFAIDNKEGYACDITEENIVVVFGAKDPAGPTVNTAVPVETVEWLTTRTREVSAAGIISVLLDDVYNGTNVVDPQNKKPDPGTFIIAINVGDGCPGGIIINKPWSMTAKSSEGMVGAIPQMTYFVQEKSDWYSNKPGFIYGYDPENCPDRSEISALAMVGGPFVDAVISADPIEYARGY